MESSSEVLSKQFMSDKLEQDCRKSTNQQCFKLRRFFKLKQRQRNKTNSGFRNIYTFLFASVLYYAICLNASVRCSDQEAQSQPTQLDANDLSPTKDQPLPSNHKMSVEDIDHKDAAGLSPEKNSKSTRATSGRTGRQYDSLMGTSSGSSGYTSVPGDGYIGQSTSNSVSAGYAAPNPPPNIGYGNEYSSQGAFSGLDSAMYPYGRAGYPTPVGGNMPPMHMPPVFGSSSGIFGSMFPMIGAKGFDVAEVVCTAIAVAIGAVIVGAPFILLYLFVMNQMNGSGTGGLSGPGGSISLTGPNASTNVTGRKKRHTTFPEALFMHLSPLINNEQVLNTFKTLMKSIAKYQP